MNYNSIQEIFDADITNMSAIRFNNYTDSGVDTLTGVDWLTFNNKVVSNIYVSADSWLGFGTQTYHLKVNQRDTSSYYVYAEEGTLYNHYKFIKIRWRGYSYWNQPTEPNLQEYDVILWETGDISLHMVNIPTQYWNGTFSLTTNSTYTYNAPTVDNPDVTFYSQNETNSEYEISYEPIELKPPFDCKYLIKSEGVLYTIVDNQLSELEVTEVTSEIFRQYGVDEISDRSVLIGLNNPQVLYWQDSDLPIGTRTALVTGTTNPQSVISNKIDLTHASITGIENALVTCEGNPLFCVSFDNKQTWKAWNGTEWSTVSEENSGMTKELFESINYDNWLLVYDGADSFYIKVILNENELTQSVTKIYVDFAN